MFSDHPIVLISVDGISLLYLSLLLIPSYCDASDDDRECMYRDWVRINSTYYYERDRFIRFSELAETKRRERKLAWPIRLNKLRIFFLSTLLIFIQLMNFAIEIRLRGRWMAIVWICDLFAYSVTWLANGDSSAQGIVYAITRASLTLRHSIPVNKLHNSQFSPVAINDKNAKSEIAVWHKSSTKLVDSAITNEKLRDMSSINFKFYRIYRLLNKKSRARNYLHLFIVCHAAFLFQFSFRIRLFWQWAFQLKIYVFENIFVFV